MLSNGGIRSGALTADAVALLDGDRRLTYGQLGRRVDALGAELLDRGLSRGSIVAILMDRRVDFVVAALAIMKAGAASRREAVEKLFASLDGSPESLHKLLIIIKIMQGCEARAEDLATLLEMPQVSQAVVLAGVAAAIRIQGAGVVRVAGGQAHPEGVGELVAPVQPQRGVRQHREERNDPGADQKARDLGIDIDEDQRRDRDGDSD